MHWLVVEQAVALYERHMTSVLEGALPVEQAQLDAWHEAYASEALTFATSGCRGAAGSDEDCARVHECVLRRLVQYDGDTLITGGLYFKLCTQNDLASEFLCVQLLNSLYQQLDVDVAARRYVLQCARVRAHALTPTRVRCAQLRRHRRVRSHARAHHHQVLGARTGAAEVYASVHAPCCGCVLHQLTGVLPWAVLQLDQYLRHKALERELVLRWIKLGSAAAAGDAQAEQAVRVVALAVNGPRSPRAAQESSYDFDDSEIDPAVTEYLRLVGDNPYTPEAYEAALQELASRFGTDIYGGGKRRARPRVARMPAASAMVLDEDRPVEQPRQGMRARCSRGLWP